MNALAPALYRATMPCDLFASLPMEREGWDRDTTRIEQIGRRDEDRFWKVSR